MDLLNTAAANPPEAGGLVAAGWAITRVLGPSVSAVGNALGDWTDFRMRNLIKLDQKMARRLQQDDDPEQTVHPRVAKEVLDEGTWIDDDLHLEYLAGLMVSARSKDGVSDHQAYLARVATSLTADQVRMHYLMVSAYAGYWDGKGLCPFPFDRKDHYRRHAIRATEEEVKEKFPRFDDVARGLLREGLLTDFGHAPDVKNDPYRALIPTPLAFDLYLQALARPGKLTHIALTLSREMLRNTAALHPDWGWLITYPDPEPELLTTAQVHDLGP